MSNDLESVNSEKHYWVERPPFPLMSKDTRAGSRRTQRVIPQCVASLDISGGAFNSIKLMVEDLNKVLSDAPALVSMPTEQATWTQVIPDVR